MATGILDRLGRHDVQVNTIFHQFMAAFPQIPHRAEELILQSAVTAALSGATRVLIKTPVEAYKIPSLADNLHGLSLVGHGIALARETAVDERRIAAEAEVIRREAQEIFDSVIYCGDGNLAAGIVRAFQKGRLDVPFSPSIYSRGQVMTGRDCEGAVRFLSPGGLQLSAETRAFHEDKMQDRRRAEGLKNKKQDYLLVEKDVLQIGRSQYERWPLSG
jgi:methylaspartate mutase epsilon subunit